MSDFKIVLVCSQYMIKIANLISRLIVQHKVHLLRNRINNKINIKAQVRLWEPLFSEWYMSSIL